MRAWMIGAAGAAAAGTIVARRRAERRSAAVLERELNEVGPEVELRGQRFRLPVAYHRTDGFAAIVGADAERIAAVLPTDVLHPVRLRRDRVAVFVGAYRYHDVTIRTAAGDTCSTRPYGELMIAALVTPRPAPPIVPILRPAQFGMAGFVLALPVTTRLAMDAGREWWGLPKFVADMDFTDDVAERGLVASESGHRILSLHVRSSGRLVADRAPTLVYGVLDGSLLMTAVPTSEVRLERFGAGGATLELGDHPVAEELRHLGVDGRAFATSTVLSSRFVLPAGTVVGPAREYRGYAGVERDFARYTFSHAGTPPIDQYASWGTEEWLIVPERRGPALRPTARSKRGAGAVRPKPATTPA